MSKFRHVWMAGLIGWALACGARIDDSVGNGSNTNWLSGCVKDGQCGDGICASGACTPTCARDRDCANLGDEAACGDSVLIVSVNDDACDDAVLQQVCAPKCDGDEGCRDIGDGYTCQAGVCVPATCVTTEPTQPYEPCAGHACGDTCRVCDPADADCTETEEPKYCDADGECSGTAPTCPSEPVSPTTSCSELTPGECTGQCGPASGAAVVECELRPTRVVACVQNIARDEAACAINPTDGLCYRFSATYELETWEDVSCDDARCALDGCGVDACFSPTMNTSQAYDGTILGCDCEDVGSVCIDGVALICTSGKWEAVEDGPCFPSEEVCDGTIADVEQCIALFDTCRQSSDGLFCGVSPRTSLCDDGVIVQDESQCYYDDAFCDQLENGLWCTGGLDVSCPENYVPTDDCDPSTLLCYSAGFALMCRLQTLTDEECLAAVGESVNDPGDGSLYTEGCPNGGQAVGWMDHGAEGGLCCVAPGTADAG